MEGNRASKKKKRKWFGMKIGITCYPSVGGSGIIATELGKLLAERGHDIHFITSSVPFRLNEIYPNIYFHEVEVNHYPVFQYPPYDLSLANKMAEVMDQEKLDILHVHYAMPHAVCAILARDIAQHKVKIVTTLHGTDITVLGIDKSLKKMIKHGIEQSDVVTAVSKSLVEQTQQMLDVSKDIHVVYNFVNEAEYYRSENKKLKLEYGIKDEEKVIIHISNFRKVKRVEDVILAFEKIKKQIPAKLLLVGDGPEHSEIYQLVQEKGLQQNVLFLGKQRNIPQLFSIADLKLLLSEKESFGLVLLEAMACGVPGIGTKIGGIPEVIVDGVNGHLVELGDIDDVCSKAIKLLSNPDQWRQFSEAAIGYVHDHFNSKRILNEFLTLYELALKTTGDENEKQSIS
ncbi:N-acetyl-alpha-D-glucosaminyl L-malate synthase BshA [Aquibacillus sp. 3ASR75-11]|uniref:N-acetyl-alpha-D-glucosaminyl L-malate synthase BshA n=1 Tax=Terrihalobacillus insolitus TaxID=2950438 RepID=A0A9X3WUC6_9BACI|nr:N-acetyl-alpha-D-glucosaminyl L-malate synthase BshA [Terrihalobacillus insolitus]MDC3413031.1 N-acetyl-alpha-D-glucosaminyl L-malate synthase BshA [Terrihalobacillus insolitus]MDC3424773.1 N-acetyl-alpha-D-glucosaminyl L-malate synthase BshA [Terrihalobacillus insolitus]